MPAATESHYLLLGERVPAVGFFLIISPLSLQGRGWEGGCWTVDRKSAQLGFSTNSHCRPEFELNTPKLKDEKG